MHRYRYSILRTVVLLTSAVLPSAPAQSSIKVKLHDNATLPCSQKCSGPVTWTVSKKTENILAQCDQASCQSEEGFHMSHDQYLKGDLSLTITDADFTKRTWYTCVCDGVHICDVSLRVEALQFSRQVAPGEPLTLDVPVSEPVELILDRTGDTSPNAVRLCEVKGREIWCNSEYEQRVLFGSTLQLMELKQSDSGVYTIRDTKNDEVVSTIRVTVQGKNTDTSITFPPVKGVKEWVDRNYEGLLSGLAVGLLLGVLICYFVIPLMFRCWDKFRKFRKKGWCFGRGHCTGEETSDLSATDDVMGVDARSEDVPLKTVCVDADQKTPS